MAKHSWDDVVVEYGAREMIAGKSPSSAAKSTAKKIGGYTNLFIGGGSEIVDIDPIALEEALWGRLVDFTVAAIPRIKPGKEHYALGGTLAHFHQKIGIRKKLKEKIINALGKDPFPHDDGT